MTNTIEPGFFRQGIRVVKITDWLDWATRMETTADQWAVVLPMIQRDSIWKPQNRSSIISFCWIQGTRW